MSKSKLRRPALVNLRIVESPVQFRELSPSQLPDLFFGEELVVFGRYQGEGRGAVVIEGERNGHRERFTAEAVFPAVAAGNEFIPRLWASRRIGDLTRQIRLEGANDELIREVRELGLRHGVLTEYTSYLVQEPGALAARDGRTPMPMATRNLAPAAPSAQTGQVAFERARESGKLSQASSLAEADAAAADKFTAIGGGRRELKRAGGRVFALTDGIWTDLNQRDSLRVVAIAPYSPAYFAITRALPEIGPSLAVGDAVLVAGRRASLKVVVGGLNKLSDSAVQQFVRDFKGASQ
jgi:Ca-activated chloride channel family protein